MSPDEAGGRTGGPAVPRRVVIVGGGFGGVAAAHALRHAPVAVTLVDRKNHHLFQPLLYQVAAGALSSGDCATPIRALLKRQSNVEVLMAEVAGIDAEQQRVTLDRGEELPYDSLILACGAETSYFGHDEWQDVTCGLKTLGDAVDLRNRIFGAFEEAERATDPVARAEWLTFAVVGGGPTGVEIAGQLAILAQHAMRHDFGRIDPADAHVILFDAGERVVPAFRPRLSAKAGHALGKLGASVREGVRVTEIDARGVTVEQDGRSERIAARTVVWAAGVRTAGVAGALAQATGAATDRAGRVIVGPQLTVTGHPEVSVIGDAASAAGADGRPLPGLATVAIQQARHVAKAIAQGEPGASTPFRYFDKGALAVVGRGRAVCEIRGLGFAGLPAFLTYLGVHLYYLGSGAPGRRLQVLTAWASVAIGARQSRVVEGELASVERPASA